MPFEFKSTSGRSVDSLLVDLQNRVTVTQADMQLVGEIVKSDIRKKTAEGRDADNAPFEPYDTTTPYYYNPSTGGGKFPAPHIDHQKLFAAKLHATLRKHGLGGTLSRTGTTIRFDSYAAFKQAFARLTVDLFGVDAPHMLEKIMVEATTDTAVISIRGEEAERANAHNSGLGRQPERRFFAIGEDTARRIVGYFQNKLRGRA